MLTDPADTSAPRLLCIGGEDHELRIPFLLALRAQGLSVAAVGGAPTAFARAGIEWSAFTFKRFIGPRADMQAVCALVRLLRQARPDIVQGFDTKPALLVPLAARAQPDLRAVRTINGMGWVFSARSPVALALRPAYRLLHRHAARHAAMTVFQNATDQAYFLRHGMARAEASRLIPGSGIDIAGFERALAEAPPVAALRESLGLADAEIVITVSRLTRQKGIPTLLAAARLVHRRRPRVRFLLVGPRESEGRLAVGASELAQHAPYVQPLGQRSDVASLLRLADVFAFPTEYREGVPRVLLEAALAGVPIVTTRMPGCSDVVHDGSSGIEVPPCDPQALADGVVALLDQRRRAGAMAARARAHVRAEFGLDLTASRYASLYRALLRRPFAAPGAVPAAIAARGPA